jgi:tyrosine phenol-lyase
MSHPIPQTMGQQAGRRSWAEPWKIKMVEPLQMIGRAERERRAGPGRIQHVPTAVGRRVRGFAHRQRYQRYERPPVGGDDARRRGLRGQPQLLSPGRSRADGIMVIKHIVPTHQGARRRAPDQPRDAIKPGPVRAGQYVLHDDATAPGVGRRRLYVDVIIDEAHDPAEPTPLQGQRRSRPSSSG